MTPTITSLLDTDFYKLTMAQAVFHRYPSKTVAYRFINRSNTSFPNHFGSFLKHHIDAMRALELSPYEKEYIQNISNRIFKTDFVEWLSQFRFDPSTVSITQNGGTLDIQIRGSWLETILWETPLLALIYALYYEQSKQYPSDDWEQKTIKKAQTLETGGIHFIDFGTRRRYSKKVHQKVITILKAHVSQSFLGTSNVLFAMEYDLRPIGTFAHEWVMAHAGMGSIEDANAWALDTWYSEYGAGLSIAVTDTYTTGNFLKSFNQDRAKAYRGVRNDSGNPIEFITTMIMHYQKHQIDPREKTIVFSNNLTVDRCVEIVRAAGSKIQTVFGIGGNLTNDVGAPRPDFVIKMFEIEGRPVYKLSDDAYKSTK